MHINALEHLYKEHYKSLLKRALVIVGDVEKAEDVLHDVFMKLLDQPKRWATITDMKAYLFQSVTNSALNHWKSNQRLTLLDDSHEIMDSQKMNLEEQESLEMLKERLVICLSQLTPRLQLVFKLSRYEGLDHEEIATHLDISKNTVKNQLVTTLAHLRACLSSFFRGS
jgi:RNA polymerase sigma-70 factor (ECF subfamily)